MNHHKLQELLNKELREEKDTELGSFVQLLVQKSLNQKELPVGLSLAATFDLLVGLFYYQKVPSKGWLFCPNGEQLYFFPFVNACPRCAVQGRFEYHKAGKSQSANIGSATIKALILFIQEWFNTTNNKLIVLKGEEPVDLCIYDRATETIFLAEVKSAPLLTLPLVIKPHKDTEEIDFHESQTIGGMIGSTMGVMLPTYVDGNWLSKKYYFNSKFDGTDRYFIDAMTILVNDNDFFRSYLETWNKGFLAYSQKAKSEGIFWLTNGCGSPYPSPDSWPLRSGSGKETISDGKTSVGLDRTDDIKKGVYQLLKLRLTPINDSFNVKIGIFSNTHAARHHEEYIEPIKDIMWLKSELEGVKTSGELPDSTPVYNLFDGIITFTKSFTKDQWLKQNFNF